MSHNNFTIEYYKSNDGFCKRRIKPENSKLENPIINGKIMSCKDMWNHIRCREDPYPNAYFEDETGVLMIKNVEFITKG